MPCYHEQGLYKLDFLKQLKRSSWKYTSLNMADLKLAQKTEKHEILDKLTKKTTK